MSALMDLLITKGMRWLNVMPLVFGCCVTKALTAPGSHLYSALPPLLNQNSDSMVMLLMSVDHELFKKAYPDYSDLDGDGQIDTTYNNAFEYLGYFESNWCYNYQESLNRFIPEQQASGDYGHYCDSTGAQWSGNFLNWATMSRIDVLRRVLFGGKRFIDSDSATVLERAYLPRDIHAFAKVYSGSDITRLTPYDNVITLCNLAVTEYGDPVVRIARGSYPRWASTEVIQCQWGSGERPGTNKKVGELIVRNDACVIGKDADTSTRCRSYGNGSKPAGLLQRYGEEGGVQFGLMSGSYDKNISGGVLRKNISKISGNDVSSSDEIDKTTGVFNASVKGIIHHINTFRIANYSYGSNKYTDCSTYGISVGTFKSGRGTYSNRHCSNWGNPVAEMYLEALRYFSGNSSPTSAFNTSEDHVFVPGLTVKNWEPPLNESNACAACSIIILSSGLNSFDSDELSSSVDIPGLTGTDSVAAKTDEVGVMEYAQGFAGYYLVGGTGSTRQCTSKYLSGLSKARGICPEIPQLEGSYQLAGLAWHGHKTDLLPSLEGGQSVKTYAVQLSENMPTFSLNAAGKTVTFQPVCHTSSNFGSGTNFSGSGSDCTLTDVLVEELVSNGAGESVEGHLLFTWEDSLWGNDFDYDASSRIKFCVGARCVQTSDPELRVSSFADDQVRIAVQVDGVYAGLNMRFSYAVNGTYDDGLTTDYVYKGQVHYEVNSFTASGQTAGLLEKPLWFAAKYGGFTDLDGDGTPGYSLNGVPDHREWDNRNNTTGNIGSDGLPDNYFLARNPTLLDVQLGQILADISNRVSSGTNTALFANNQAGSGVIYQALFHPEQKYNDKTVTWGGLLHALFVDGKGLLREDTNDNDQLDGYEQDSIVELVFDALSNQTKLQRYTTDDGGVTQALSGEPRPLSELKTVWDARDQLSQVSNLVDQRHYDSIASSGRHIMTWLDNNHDGVVTSDETVPLIPGSFSGVEGYLAVDAAESTQLIHYIRGVDVAGFRNRTIDYHQDGTDKVWRLGDIVHSTPHLVSSPRGRFDALYSDTSYTAFLEHYRNRRHVVYVGANDGMIHAFNGGFWNNQIHGYTLTTENGETAHPLGSELWAYAPMNLLPHLKWLKESDYPHVYYVDGDPVTFDANIFDASDPDHPGGWGTLMVMGMRLGGGDFDVTINGHTKTMRSAYVVLDVTNPEKPPELLAEISHPELGFTTSKPALIKRRSAAQNAQGDDDWSLDPAINDWFLVFGSGPIGTGESGLKKALKEGSSDQNLKLFVYDLKTLSFASGLSPLDTGIPAAYAGDITVMDWNDDYKDDVVYFGTTETGSLPLKGRMMRLRLASDIGSSTLTTFIDAQKPVTMAPTASKDRNNQWLFFGSGRLLTAVDNKDSQTQHFYGVKEPLNSQGALSFATVAASDLIDTSDVLVYSNGSIAKQTDSADNSFTVGTDTISHFSGLKKMMSTKPGWQVTLSGGGSAPAGRTLSPPARLFSLMLFTEYQPPADYCRADGTSSLYAVHYQTGTATPDLVLYDLVPDNKATAYELSLKKVALGVGAASSPEVHQGFGGVTSAIVQGASASVSRQQLNYQFGSSGAVTWRQIFNIP